MNSLRPHSQIGTILLTLAGAVALTCAPGRVAWAQHAGGGFGGGHAGGTSVGHAGTGGHAGSAPHVAMPRASGASGSHGGASGPAIIYLPPSGGPRAFAAPPPVVHMIPPPGSTHPVLGSHVIMPPVVAPVEPHTTVGFPSAGSSDVGPLRFSPVMSFSGQGHQIWQDPTGPARPAGTTGAVARGRGFAGAAPQSSRIVPRRPRTPNPIIPAPRSPRPIFPIFAPPTFGFLGSPLFGLGFGFGYNSLWWPSCGPYWGWGYGCNALPYYDYGLGYGYGPGYEPGYEPDNLEAQNGTGPQVYENPYPIGPTYYDGGEGRELVQLYLEDGTVYNVTDYWLVNDQLHFTTSEQGGHQSVEHVINFDQLDLQKTIDVNTANGFRFVLRNEPIDEYLQQHPDMGPSHGPPQTGPGGPQHPPANQPQAAPAPDQPAQPTAPPQP
jgi:hypothetical protein